MNKSVNFYSFFCQSLVANYMFQYIGDSFYNQLCQTTMIEKQKDYKKINARIMKWRQMLQNDLSKDKEALNRRVRKGIPKSIRIKVWPQLAKTNKKMKEPKLPDYNSILAMESYYLRQINLDIPRTFSIDSNPMLRQSLFNVLKALSIQFPKLGYCQGMNFLVMRLLEILNDDSAFYIMVRIIKRHKQVYQNFCNPAFVHRQNYVLTSLFKKYLKKIYEKLKQQNIDPIFYTPRWILTFFSKSLTNQQFYRFFECFLLEGYSFVYKMVLTLMKVKQEQILSNSHQQNLFFLQDDCYYKQMNESSLIQICYSWNFDNSLISNLQKQYDQSSIQSIQKIRNIIKQNYKNRVLSPPRKFEWTLQDFRKTEISLIQFDEL